MFLLDTNIFLEILLRQARAEDCKRFLMDNGGGLHMTDLSLHSIGIVLFRYRKEDTFWRFVQDVLPEIRLVALPTNLYAGVVDARKDLALDFDDAYQYTIAKLYGLRVVTMDRDFERTRDVEIQFL